MKYSLIMSSRFKKSMKRAVKRGLDVSLIQSVVDTLLAGVPLDPKFNDHPLRGSLKGLRECHIEPDWLLIYMIENDILTLTLIDTGSHSDLFDM